MKKNDYNVKQYHKTSSVVFDWIDLCADDTKDVCGCQFTLKKSPSFPNTACNHVVNEEAIMWQVQYVCAQAGQHIVFEDAGNESKTPGVEILDDS